MSAVRKIRKLKSPVADKINGRPFIVGITGIIGAGKSTGAEYLRKEGYKVIDVDRFAHGLYRKGRTLYRRIVKRYGRIILKKTGEIDRKKLRSIVFSSVKKYKEFNRIVFPELNRALLSKIKDQKSQIVFLDMAVLFESGFYRETDLIIFVKEEKQVWKKRMRKVNKAVKAEKVASFQRIFSISKKIALSDYIIYNNKTVKILNKSFKLLAERVAKSVYGEKRQRRKNKGAGRKGK